ncbi:MAG TPA: 4Fe-4S binding protein [Actinomycetota bacterium]|nr:4Fe-4S binding protein [Actinomycetota bacterium]
MALDEKRVSDASAGVGSTGEKSFPDAAARYEQTRLKKARGMTLGIGLLKGMAVTLKHLFKRNSVIQYPDERQDLSPRTRGVIALKEENCTVCMLCGRECPDWCIYIDSHKETLPPKREGGRQRKRNVLDRFAIDYALCMYCGICVEVCPYDALFWSREFEYAEYDIRNLTHEKERLSDWMATVLPPPPLEEGALLPGQPEPEMAAPEAPAAAAPTTAATGARPATTTASAVEARPEQAEAAPKGSSAATEPARPTETLPEGEQKDETMTVGGPEAPKEQPAQMTEETKDQGAPSEPRVAKEPGPAEASDASGGRVAEEASASAATSGAERSGEPAGPSDAEAVPAEEPAELTPAQKAQFQAEPGPNVEVPHEDPKPIALERTEDPEEVYRQVLEEQRAKGSSPQVAEARAKVARVKAERGIKRGPTPVEVDKPVPSAPTKGQPAEPEPSGAPEAKEITPEPGPVAPTEDES